MSDAHTEIELKLQVPPSALKAVTRELTAGKVGRTRLQALYFDTPDRRLAAAGMAVRIRLEGRKWVQTVKAGDPHEMTRHEHNVPLGTPANGALPTLDLSRHDGTRAGTLLAGALAARHGEAPAELVPLYRTDIERTHRVVRVPGGRVELALDVGRIVAADREWPVCELEIELVSGHPDAVIGTAREWVRRHRLWLDSRSKAERGDRLARNETAGHPVRATAPKGPAQAVARQACRIALAAGLAHVLPNLSEVAGGPHTPEHVHQLRTGLRRLVATMALFDGIAGPGDDVLRPIDDARRALGGARDRDAVADAWQPRLAAAGAPVAALPASADAVDATTVARGPALMDALLALQSWCVPDGTLGPQHADFPGAVCDRLRRWHRRVVRSARDYDALDEADRHRLRRRVKRLRDALSQVQFLFRKKPLEAALARLDRVQQALGDAHDLAVAITAYGDAARADPQALFAAGWLTAQRPRIDAAARKAARRLAAAAPLRPHAALKAR